MWGSSNLTAVPGTGVDLACNLYRAVAKVGIWVNMHDGYQGFTITKIIAFSYTHLFHLMGGAYNTTGIDLPFSPFADLKDFRYKGHFYGGGVSYGYQFVLGRHWNLGATIGLGYALSLIHISSCPPVLFFRGLRGR